MLAIKSGMGIVKKSQRNLFSPVYLKILQQVFVATFFFFFFCTAHSNNGFGSNYCNIYICRRINIGTLVLNKLGKKWDTQH